jgi:hypothetical protein
MEAACEALDGDDYFSDILADAIMIMHDDPAGLRVHLAAARSIPDSTTGNLD